MASCDDGLVFVRTATGEGLCVDPEDVPLVPPADGGPPGDGTDLGAGDLGAGDAGDGGAGDAFPSTVEVCDGNDDDDCDDLVDEGCECTNDDVEACDVPDAFGACVPGDRACADGTFGPCLARATPGDETCNGLDDDCDGETDESPGLCVPTAVSAEAGVSTTCAVLPGADVVRWGDNFYRMASPDGTLDTTAPVSLVGLGGFGRLSAVQVELGFRSGCAVLTSGRLACWGSRGIGIDVAEVVAPTQVRLESAPFLDSVRDVSVGTTRVCAVGTADGSLACWLWDTDETPAPVRDGDGATLEGIRRVAVGSGHVCFARVDGTAGCFPEALGSAINQSGELGDGTTDPEPSEGPRTVVWADSGRPLTGVVDVTAGIDFACALLATGRVACWGADARIGDDRSSGPLGARLVLREDAAVLEGASRLASKGTASCALGAASGEPYVRCWGRSSASEELGVALSGSGVTLRVATPIEAELSAANLTMGDRHTCAWPEVASRVECWGSNVVGELGIGTTVGGGAEPREVLLPAP
ncbi:MAG: hypothetical protein AAF447_16715 [Myxococcota bacterium]